MAMVILTRLDLLRLEQVARRDIERKRSSGVETPKGCKRSAEAHPETLAEWDPSCSRLARVGRERPLNPLCAL